MGKIFKKELITTQLVDFGKCDGCGRETPVWNIIDNWCIVEGKDFCRICQEELKIGWYKEK